MNKHKFVLSTPLTPLSPEEYNENPNSYDSAKSERRKFQKKKRRSRTRKRKIQKIKINPFKSPEMPKNYFEETWKNLENSIRSIFESREYTSYGHEQLYQFVKNLVIHKLHEKLFKNLESLCIEYMMKIKDSLLNSTKDTSISYLLKTRRIWENFKEQSRSICLIFLNLDLTYISKTRFKTLMNFFFQNFRSIIIQTPQIKHKIVQSFLSFIEKERAGDDVNRTLLHTITRMLDHLNSYIEIIEKNFLHTSNLYYNNAGMIQFQNLQTAEFLEYVEKILNLENKRINDYLLQRTQPKIIRIVHLQLIKNRCQIILDNGFEELLETDNYSLLRFLHQNFIYIKEMEIVRNSFSQYIYKKGKLIVHNKTDENHMIKNLIIFQKKLKFLILKSFKNSKLFFHEITKSFTKFINERNVRPPQLIAKYMHDKLIERKIDEFSLVERLNDALELFKFIESKDIFEQFYKELFAHRLLLKLSTSNEVEREIIKKLKQEIGKDYTRKLEGMMRDIVISKEINKKYQNKSSKNKKGQKKTSMQYSFTILKTGVWPSYEESKELLIPQEVFDKHKEFSDFYIQQNSGRRLKWISDLETSIVYGRFEKGSKEYEFTSSTEQTLVLLALNRLDQFTNGSNGSNSSNGMNDNENNQNRTMTVEDLMQITGIKRLEMMRKVLKSLRFKTDGKIHRIILMQSTVKPTVKVENVKEKRKGSKVDNKKKKRIELDTLIKANKDFSYKNKKIKINRAQIHQNLPKDEDIQKNVVMERDVVVEAAIVRIMKINKILSHKRLISETIKLVKQHFVPDVSHVKKRIEVLLTAEYIERSDNLAEYKYIA